MTRFRHLFATLTACVLLMLPASLAQAQNDGGYTAVITNNEVEVRSGAGRAYYVVGVMETGQQVEVVDVLFDASWYQIVVPEGVYSYVSKAFVNAQGDGSIGVVNADRTECKAAALRGPGASYRVQHLFDEGDRVEIVGEEGNYYKIVSPQEAYVFVPAGVLRRATAQELAARPDDNEAPAETQDNTDAAPPAVQDDTDNVADATQDAADDATGTEVTDDEVVVLPPTVVPDAIELPVLPDAPVVDGEGGRVEIEETTQDEAVADAGSDTETVNDNTANAGTESQPEAVLPAAPDVEVSTPARSEAMIAKEMELLPYFAVPIQDRPLDHMEAEYRALLETGDLPRVDEQIVAVRLRTISRQREILAAMDRVEAARSVEAPRAEITIVEPQPRIAADYQAIGRLEVSSVYDGQSLPRMYRLVDPSGRTVAYVAPTPAIDESDLLNTLVGVVGTASYDPALKLRIITPEQLDALAAED
ncbi:MAG: SH3 domain-containing protein [Planctomycetota bacterium]